MPRRSGQAPPSSAAQTPRSARKKFWHTPAVILLEATAPYSHELIQEVQLRRQPQRIDLLILKRTQAAFEEITHLEALYSRLGDVNLIELKGGTDHVERLDAHILLGYASQLRVSIERPPRRVLHVGEKASSEHASVGKGSSPAHFLDISPGSDMRLVVLAPVMKEEFRAEIFRLDGSLTKQSTGVWEGRLAGYPLIFLETEEVWKTSQGNRLFYALTQGVIEGPESLGLLTEREEEVYIEVMEWLLEQPPIRQGGIEMRMEKIREYQARQLERKMAWLNSLPPEERLKGLRPEERLKGLRPEERLKGLRPEERLKGISAEEVLKQLKPEERLKGIPAEEMLKQLKPEERVQGLPPEELLRSLSDEARQALARLLQDAT